MSVGWERLPLLPLGCVLARLEPADALRATAACRHWRSAVVLYEGRRDTVKLRVAVNQLEKNLFITRLFKKHVKRLHVYLDCNEEDLNQFMTYVMPQYFDSVDLQELLFIDSRCTQQKLVPVVKLKRILTESLILKHLNSLQKLGLIGCEMDVANNADRYTHKNTEYYSRSLTFNSTLSPTDTLLSSCNTRTLGFTTLQHIMMDYEQVSTEALETLSQLSQFGHLTLGIHNRRQLRLAPVDWGGLRASYPRGLDVSVVIVGLPYRKLTKVIDNVLVEGLTLTSLKVLFCQTLCLPLISHAVRLYKASLRELVWADAFARNTRPDALQEYDTCNVNPFVVLCWQCTQLRRLVIHGYWVWEYDVLGFVRLRKTLEHLEVSAISGKPRRAARVSAYEPLRVPDCAYIEQVNAFTDFPWRPAPSSALHPALRARASASQRADYVACETRRAYGGPSYPV